MGPLEILVEEHNAVRALLEVLEVICGRLESKRKVDPDHIQSAVRFIKDFADKAHHLKEEEVLFPAMESAGVSREEMLLDAITTEHDLGRGYVRGISDALFPYSLGDYSAGDVVCQNARKYIKLMSNHIAKEEEIVFPLAESRLSENARRELAREFERIDREVIGQEKREDFQSILLTLRGAYLIER